MYFIVLNFGVCGWCVYSVGLIRIHMINIYAN